MDSIKAKNLEKDLLNTHIEDFEVISLINYGKSAAVFKAQKNGILYAMKIFDNEIVERFGYEIQTKRIEQEISLKNHTIPNLVKIFDGGVSEVGDNKYFYLIMEYIEGKNLKEYIYSNEYSIEFVLKALKTLIETTERLLTEKNIVHRDIKPENIMVNTRDELILMDLGVLKLIGAKSFSDEEEKSFVGTLRYAAPEFLRREENDSHEGWRSINYYQIGATLHDLIMKEELFIDKIPYSNLVIAIKEDIPRITNMSYPFELLQLVRDMLGKDWKLRLKLITNERIKNIVTSSKIKGDSLDESIEELKKMKYLNIAQFDEIEKLNRTKAESNLRREEIGKQIGKLLDKCFSNIQSKGIFETYSKSEIFHFSGDSGSEYRIQNLIYHISGTLVMGFPQKLYILVRYLNTENSFAEINIVGFFPVYNPRETSDPKFQIKRNLSPKGDIYNQINKFGPSELLLDFNTFKIFNGVIEIGVLLENELTLKIAKVIFKAIKLADPHVKEKIESQRKMAESQDSIIITPNPLPRIIVDDIN